MITFNQKIFHQKVPDIKELQFEEKNMMSMVLPEDLYIRENDEKLKKDKIIFCSDLELLVPNKYTLELQQIEKDLKNALTAYRNAKTPEEQSQSKLKAMEILKKKKIMETYFNNLEINPFEMKSTGNDIIEPKINKSDSFLKLSLIEPPLFDEKEKSNEFNKVDIPGKQPNKNGENQINDNRINYFENSIKELKLKLQEKDKIINKEKNKNKELNETILGLKNEIEQLKFYILSQDEKLIYIKIISTDQKINFSLFAKDTDIFNKIENLLYQKYPSYIETNNYFLVNGMKINKYKTLKDNKIKNNDILTLVINEFDE